ncbi:MAG: methylenetetrahydrofolate reductase [Deltaproteobacteria bacterium]|nr:methylenetetrahydrofolate reductase [Deltaproteobacteria bacterium]
MRLQEKLEAKEFVVLAEMEPPKGVDISAAVSSAMSVKNAVDAFVVPEMSNAVMRMSSLGGAMVLANKGLETVIQVCCRDRNRLALQGDLLAAHALGIKNVMAVAGEDISFGDHHKARAVNDIDLLELLGAIKTLMSGKDMAGIELKGAPDFFVGSTVNPSTSALELEIQELDRKIAAGARFFITPPIFDIAVLEKFQKRLEGRQVFIIPTVLLLKSVGMARYLQRHFEQVHLPEEFITRIQKAPERVRECVQIAGELVAALKARGASGVHLATIGWEDKLPAILATAGI